MRLKIDPIKEIIELNTFFNFFLRRDLNMISFLKGVNASVEIIVFLTITGVSSKISSSLGGEVNAAINDKPTSFINLNVRLFLIGVVQELIDAIKGNGFTHVINFEGQINLNKFQVPLNLKYTVG